MPAQRRLSSAAALPSTHSGQGRLCGRCIPKTTEPVEKWARRRLPGWSDTESDRVVVPRGTPRPEAPSVLPIGHRRRATPFPANTACVARHIRADAAGRATPLITFRHDAAGLLVVLGGEARMGISAKQASLPRRRQKAGEMRAVVVWGPLVGSDHGPTASGLGHSDTPPAGACCAAWAAGIGSSRPRRSSLVSLPATALSVQSRRSRARLRQAGMWLR